jgi:hypothetical protein
MRGQHDRRVKHRALEPLGRFRAATSAPRHFLVAATLIGVFGCAAGSGQAASVESFMIHQYGQIIQPVPGKRDARYVVRSARCDRTHGTVYHCMLRLGNGDDLACRVDYRLHAAQHRGVSVTCTPEATSKKG